MFIVPRSEGHTTEPQVTDLFQSPAEEVADIAAIVLDIVSKYYPKLIPAVRACLAVVASLALKGRTFPLCLILEGISGYGKTAVLQMFFSSALLDSVTGVIYRSDKFTPKSFVSHATNVKRKDLAEVDLLPKLRDKTLITKELAPLFRGREDVLVDTFSQLCTVLDGKGLTTDSGTQGQRGYKEYLIFNWLGATTPVPAETHVIMYQLGTRLLFYEIESAPITTEELFQYLKRGKSKEAEDECRKAVKILLGELFRRFPVNSVEPESIGISDKHWMEISKWGQLVAAGRAEIKRERQSGFSGGSKVAVAANPSEAPYKIGNYFAQLARGSALVNGRKQVDASDIELVAHVAISSIPCYFRPLVRQLQSRNTVNSTEAAEACGVTAPTARKYLHELSLLGFGTLEKGCKAASGVPERPDILTRAEEFDWMQRKKRSLVIGNT